MVHLLQIILPSGKVSYPDTIKDDSPFPMGSLLPYPYMVVHLRRGWTKNMVAKEIREGRYVIDDGELARALFGPSAEKK